MTTIRKGSSARHTFEARGIEFPYYVAKSGTTGITVAKRQKPPKRAEFVPGQNYVTIRYGMERPRAAIRALAVGNPREIEGEYRRRTREGASSRGVLALRRGAAIHTTATLPYKSLQTRRPTRVCWPWSRWDVASPSAAARLARLVLGRGVFGTAESVEVDCEGVAAARAGEAF